ncbi:MAG: hypothetical protein ACOX3T_07000 [Bdellovibrionota bacterium]
MSLEKIVIKELSSNAEIINIFNCLAGKITVLSGSNTSIDSLERAFSGIYEKNDLKIFINDALQFDPAMHSLVGYNHILKDVALSVGELFKTYGFDESDIEIILNTFGLHNTKGLKIYELDDDKKKRLEYAISLQESNKALIIKEPFKDLLPQWKEPIAKNIHTYASKKNLPVIITKLDYDASFWNDSNLIKKFKLGISRTKTIGFGSNNQDLKDFLSQVRNEIENQDIINKNITNIDLTKKDIENKDKENRDNKNTALLADSLEIKEKLRETRDPIPIPPIASQMKKREDFKPEVFEDAKVKNETQHTDETLKKYSERELKNIHRILFTIGFLLIVSSLLIVGFLFKRKSDSNYEEIKTRQEIFLKNINEKSRKVENKNFDNLYILDNYPEWIKHTIELQFKKKEILQSKTFMPLTKNSKQADAKKTDGNLFQLLEGLSGTGKNLPDSTIMSNNEQPNRGYGENSANANQNQISKSDAEAKRRLLYQRFQEAIKRSREKQ